MHVNQHGGSAYPLLGGPYPGAISDLLPKELDASARLLPLNAAFAEVQGLKDPNPETTPDYNPAGAIPPFRGGKRRASRKNRKASRKNRKASRKNRKASRRSARKASRKSRRASRKSRKANRKSRKALRRRRGGAPLGYESVKAPGMLLPSSMYRETGLNPEWKLAENPNAFAPVQPRA